jgi:hypothetical protein
MKTQRIMLRPLLGLVLGLAPLAFGQFPSHVRAPHRNPWNYDPGTVTVAPLAATQDPDAPAITPTTGTLVFNVTISAKTAVPKNGAISCFAIGFISESSGFRATEIARGTAKLVSGTTYSCNLMIPYSWLLASAGSDMIHLDTFATVGEGVQLTATNGTGIVVVPATIRSTIQSTASIKVPANGTTTTETVAVTI